MKKILLFLGIAALFVSCASDDATDNKTNGTTLSAIIDDADEMTRIGLSGTSNILDKDDILKVWSDKTPTPTEMKVAATGSGAQKLTGTAPERNSVYYAAGINSGADIQSNTNTDGTVHMWFPRPGKLILVTETENQLSNTEFPVCGKTDANGTLIKLKNVACLLRMKVTNSSGSDIKCIEMKDGTKQIPGQYNINISNLYTSSRAATSLVTTYQDQQLWQNVSIPNGSTRYVYFVVSDFENYTPTFTFYKSENRTDVIKSIKTTNAVETMHGRIVKMNDYTVPTPTETGRWAQISANYVFHPGSLAPDDWKVMTPARYSDGKGGSQTDPNIYFDAGDDCTDFPSLMTEEQMVAAIQSYYIDESIQWKNHSGVTHTGGIWLKKNAGSMAWTATNSKFANTTLKATITDSNWDTYKADIEANYFFVPFIGQLEGSGTTYTCTNEGTGFRLVSSTAKQYGGVTSYANAELYYNIGGSKGVYRQGITTTTPWGGALKSNGEFITK